MLAVAKLLPKNGERRFYSRSPADPLSEGVLLPPTGIEVSTAIISARMSSTGCGLLATPLHAHDAGGTHLGYRLVVNVDQLSWVRVDLQCAVEAQCGFDVICACVTVSTFGLLPL
jgi:hypothetical protein